MSNKLAFAFERKNYRLLFIGIGILILGYILMSGGGTSDPSQFNADELFSTRRITIAPLVVMIGYLFVGYAIMFKAKPAAGQQAQELVPDKKKK